MTHKRIKVLQLTGGLNRGGAEMVVINLCNFLNPSEFEVRICSLMDSIPMASRLQRPDDVRVTTCGIGPGIPSAWNYLQTARRVHKVVQEFGPDVIHSHLYSIAAPLEMLGSFGMKARHAMTIHIAGLHYNRKNNLPAAIFRLCESATIRMCDSQVIAVSNAVRDVAKRGLFISRSRLQTIYNGVDTELYSRERTARVDRSTIGCEDSDLLVIYTARFHDQKGHVYLLDAWPRVKSAVPNAKLVLVGEGHLREPSQEQARRLGISDSIRFLGLRDDVPGLLAASDLAVFPSLFEGLSVAAIEMMSMGLPIVGTTIKPLLEIINPPEAGLCVAPGQPEPLADALIRLLKDTYLRLRLGQAARRRAVDVFSIQGQVRAHEELYRKLYLESCEGRSGAASEKRSGVPNHE